jgi:hypothetical protein
MKKNPRICAYVYKIFKKDQVQNFFKGFAKCRFHIVRLIGKKESSLLQNKNVKFACEKNNKATKTEWIFVVFSLKFSFGPFLPMLS